MGIFFINQFIKNITLEIDSTSKMIENYDKKIDGGHFEYVSKDQLLFKQWPKRYLGTFL